MSDTTAKPVVPETECARTDVGRHVSAAADVRHVAAPIGADAAAATLRRGPIGALILSIISVSLLFLGWILFYFLLFLRRGPIG